jgi:hypothetical protein
MSNATEERQNLIEAVNALPDEALTELVSFVEYLRYKTLQPENSQPRKQNFLLTVAGLGSSGQDDISDSDEEILGNEIDPIDGWKLFKFSESLQQRMETLLDMKKADQLMAEEVTELDTIGELVRVASPTENQIFTHINAMMAAS